MQDLFIDTSQGRIHFHVSGEVGPVLLLLHSNGGSAFEYEFVLATLAKSFRVYAWDMPGQGDSDPLTRHLSVSAYADLVLEIMDSLKIERATVAGASIGGAICVALGAKAAGRFDRIFVIECPLRTAEEWSSNWERTESNYAPVIQSLERVKPRFRQVSEEFLKRWNIDRAKAGTKTCLSVMWALREYDITSDLKNFPAGQVLVYGDSSPTVGKVKEFAAALDSPTVHIMSDCGHFPMIDDPEAFVKIIKGEA